MSTNIEATIEDLYHLIDNQKAEIVNGTANGNLSTN